MKERPAVPDLDSVAHERFLGPQAECYSQAVGGPDHQGNPVTLVGPGRDRLSHLQEAVMVDRLGIDPDPFDTVGGVVPLDDVLLADGRSDYSHRCHLVRFG